jgi:transcriptional regulator with XRE-family HTH domain
MTHRQLRTALKRLGWSHLEGARRLGVAPRTMRYWVAGERRIPESVALLLRTWIAAK